MAENKKYRVKIGDGKFVPNGMMVDRQKIADQLDDVTSSQREFNREVVDYNKSLVVRYKEGRIIREYVIIMFFLKEETDEADADD